ncbi:hypothetical protein B0H11DRAFT_1912390 [Mycena galericulata]|nr:hypothetical protein B0H11DRAFT_1923233 [Mycena galericulata]KAJ7490426.1 hypothetical protein B0H11DRAFT_1912390 [Mycena galericulata]
MYQPTTFDTVTNLTKGAVEDEIGVDALLFATGHPKPFSVTLPIKTLDTGERALAFEAHLYGTVAETEATDAVFLHVHIGNSSPIVSRRWMQLIHIDQDRANKHPPNEAIAHLLGSSYESWFGNIIIFGCDDYIHNPESLSSDDGELACQAVIHVVLESLKEIIASGEDNVK